MQVEKSTDFTTGSKMGLHPLPFTAPLTCLVAHLVCSAVWTQVEVMSRQGAVLQDKGASSITTGGEFAHPHT